MGLDYTKIPTPDLEALSRGDYAKVSTSTLEMINKEGAAAPAGDQLPQFQPDLPFWKRLPIIGAEGANKGIANMLGMPVDLMNFIRSYPSGNQPTIDKPVGGSEWMKEKILPPQTLKPEGFVENVLGATVEQIPYAMSGGAGILSKAGKPLQTFMQVARPTVGAGIGVGTARTIAPDSPLAEMAGAMVGSLTPAVTKPLMSWMQPKGRRMVESALKMPPKSVPKDIRDNAVDTFIKEDISLSENGLQKIGKIIDDINTEIDDTIKAMPQTKTVTETVKATPQFKPVIEKYPQGAGYTIKTGPNKYIMDHGAPRIFRNEAEAKPLLDNLISKIPPDTPSTITREIGTIDTAEAAKRIEGLKEFYSKLPAKTAEKYITELNKLQYELASDGFITPERAQEMKKTIYRLNRKHYGELKSAEIEAHKAFARGIKEELVKKNPTLSNLNARDSALINLEEIVEHSLSRIRNYDIIRLADTVMAGVGGIVGGYPGAVGSTIAKQIIDTPRMKAALGKALAKAGKKPIPVPFVRAGIASGALQNYRNADE
jgi:hypothetical protein